MDISDKALDMAATLGADHCINARKEFDGSPSPRRDDVKPARNAMNGSMFNSLYREVMCKMSRTSWKQNESKMSANEAE